MSRPARKRKQEMPMDERDLLKILKEEEMDASSYYTSELAEAQTTALDRYMGAKYGDEIEGRSQVVTHDIEDTVNWMMPKLIKTFMTSDELVNVEDPKYGVSEDGYEDQGKCAADYLEHIFFKDNRGEVVLHDFVFDGLLQRIGVIRVGWEDPKPGVPKIIEGLTADGVARYHEDTEYEILEAESQLKDFQGQQVEFFTLKVQKTPKMGRCVVENIPPEEFAFSRRARSMKHSDYHRWKRETFLGDVIAQFPDFEAELKAGTSSLSSDDDEDAEEDGRRNARFPEEPSDTYRKDSYHENRRKVWLIEEDIRVDFDGDGRVELRHIKRVGDVILENKEIERSEFHEWTPIRVSHRMVGRSLADTILDLQRIRTVIMRSSLDSLSQSLVPRTVYNKTALDPDDVDALLDADIGGVVGVKGDVRQAVEQLITPDLSTTGLAMMEYMDQRSEEATGVTRHAQGLKSEAITDTKGGILALQSAANERIELVARWLGFGLQEVFQSILDNVAAHQDQPRIIKVQGKPLTIDPRTWSDEMAVTIHVGMAAESRGTKLQILQGIAEKQEQILMQAGPENPMVGLPEYRNTLAMMVEESGFRTPGRFFKDIDENYQPPEPGEDPAVAEAQAKMQLEQAKAEQQAKIEEAKFQHQAQMEQLKIAADKEIAAIKAENERQIAEMRIEAETQIAANRMEAEQELARWKTEQELELKRELGAVSAINAAASNGVSNGGVRMGGKIG